MKINTKVLNEVITYTNFIKAEIKDGLGVFLMDEKYTDGSIWTVNVDGVDFSDRKSVEDFLDERSDQGESEAFESMTTAEEHYNYLINS